MTPHDAATVCGVSNVFLSALENGKESVHLDKVLKVASCMEIEITDDARKNPPIAGKTEPARHGLHKGAIAPHKRDSLYRLNEFLA